MISLILSLILLPMAALGATTRPTSHSPIRRPTSTPSARVPTALPSTHTPTASPTDLAEVYTELWTEEMAYYQKLYNSTGTLVSFPPQPTPAWDTFPPQPKSASLRGRDVLTPLLE
jgi:hypothetical protein